MTRVILILVLIAVATAAAVRPLRVMIRRTITGGATIQQRLAECSAAETRVRERFEAAAVAYPPPRAVLVGLKAERELRVLVPDAGGWRQVDRFPILAASGAPGPKLREGDQQVPEGFYGIESLNPNSLYHLALRVSYPNDEDRTHAAEEGRTRLGGDIMIHGKAASIGCLAMGDPAIEELFVLAARVGVENVEVVLSPGLHPGALTPQSSWVRDLYARLDARLTGLGIGP